MLLFRTSSLHILPKFKTDFHVPILGGLDNIERKRKRFPVIEIRLMSTNAHGINRESSIPPEFYKNIFLPSLNFASLSAVKSIN